MSPLLKPGTYWCVASTVPGAEGVTDVHGPYATEADAEQALQDLRCVGVHLDCTQEVRPLRLIDTGEVIEK